MRRHGRRCKTKVLCVSLSALTCHTARNIVTQRQAIAEAQDKLVAELDATTHKVNRRFTTGGIALLVGSDALAILERSELVKKVAEDIAMSPN